MLKRKTEGTDSGRPPSPGPAKQPSPKPPKRPSPLSAKRRSPSPAKCPSPQPAQPPSRSPNKRSQNPARNSGSLESYSYNLSDRPKELDALDSGDIGKSTSIFFPGDMEKGRENFQKATAAYEADMAAKKNAFEAAVKRATRRQNNAEEKLYLLSKDYAAKYKVLKAKEEATATMNEALQQELEDNVRTVHSLQSENRTLRAQGALASKDQRLNAATRNIASAHATAAAKAELVQSRHEALVNLIDQFTADLDGMTIKQIKSRTILIDKDLRSILVEGAAMTAVLEEIGAGLKTLGI